MTRARAAPFVLIGFPALWFGIVAVAFRSQINVSSSTHVSSQVEVGPSAHALVLGGNWLDRPTTSQSTIDKYFDKYPWLNKEVTFVQRMRRWRASHPLNPDTGLDVLESWYPGTNDWPLVEKNLTLQLARVQNRIRDLGKVAEHLENKRKTQELSQDDFKETVKTFFEMAQGGDLPMNALTRTIHNVLATPKKMNATIKEAAALDLLKNDKKLHDRIDAVKRFLIELEDEEQVLKKQMPTAD